MTLLPMTENSSTPRYGHIPVFVHEVAAAFDFRRPALVVDGTLGLGGHSEHLLERYPQMRILGVEWDHEALAIAQSRLERFGTRFTFVEGSYAELPAILESQGLPAVDGVLIDLGLSSKQLMDSSRGFSFLRPGPLDMRMSRSLSMTAWDHIQSMSEKELADLFWRWGEEPASRRAARALKDAQHRGTLVNDAWQIASILREALPRNAKRIDPATRCFQALRILVNGELDNLERILSALAHVLAPQGRVAIISFHSLEDRAVKWAFRAAEKGCVCPPRAPQCVCGQKPWGRLVFKKALQATPEEVASNPRARSAKLRVLERR